MVFDFVSINRSLYIPSSLFLDFSGRFENILRFLFRLHSLMMFAFGITISTVDDCQKFHENDNEQCLGLREIFLRFKN